MPTTTLLPEPVALAVAALDLTEQADPNPTPRPGNRPVHTTATRLWTGGRSIAVGGAWLDDGYDFIRAAGTLGWKPDGRYGDWPMVVECLKSTPPTEADPHRRFWRLTYIEGGTYLAEYANTPDLIEDAWRPDHG